MSFDFVITNFVLAIIGGLLPSLIWLWFWLKEDKNPEPPRVLLMVFIGGCLATIPAIFLEWTAFRYFSFPFYLMLWVSIEEILKYLAAYFVAFRKPSFDEPIDAPVYLITAALGFASAENLLFMFKFLISKGMFFGFVAGNLRFVGATLMHVGTSGVAGALIAFAFFNKKRRRINTIVGLCLASVLHFLFNYFISIMGSRNESVLYVFIPLWFGILIVLYIFEKVKKINN
jgi:protease PrsW